MRHHRRNGIQVALLLALMVPAAVSAQTYAIDQGSVLLGGTASFTSAGGELYEGRDENRLTTLLINPSLGYFVVPGLAIGAEITLLSVAQDVSETAFGIGPSVSYYLGDAQSRVFPFVSGSLLYLNISDFGSQTALNVSGGGAFMVAKNVAITGETFFMIERLNPERGSDTISGNTLGLAFGVIAFLY